MIFIDDLAKLFDSYDIVVKIFVDNVKVCLQITGLNDAADLQMSLELMS